MNSSLVLRFMIYVRSSHRRCSIKKGVLRNFTKFTTPVPESLLNKVATLLKKRLWHRRFPMNSAKFLRTPFFTEHLQTTTSVHVTYIFVEYQTKAIA